MIINMTPHDCHILTNNGTITIPRSGKTIRLTQKILSAGFGWYGNSEIPYTKTAYGEPIVVTSDGEEAMPIEDCEHVYIVSQLVKSALPKRGDLVVPAELVRDEDGKIVGCRSLGL